MKPKWVDHSSGSFCELARGIRIACTIDRKLGRYRVTFAGVGWYSTFPTLAGAKIGSIRLANDVVAEILHALLELESNGGEEGAPV